MPEPAGAGLKLPSIAVGAILALASVPRHMLARGARISDVRDGLMGLRSGVELDGVRVSISPVPATPVLI